MPRTGGPACKMHTRCPETQQPQEMPNSLESSCCGHDGECVEPAGKLEIVERLLHVAQRLNRLSDQHARTVESTATCRPGIMHKSGFPMAVYNIEHNLVFMQKSRVVASMMISAASIAPAASSYDNASIRPETEALLPQLASALA